MQTAPDLIFLSLLQSVQNCSFQQTRHRAKSHRTWTIDRMKASKYPLEICGCPLPFWDSTQSDFRRNSTRFEFTDCCMHSGPNWHRYRIALFGGDVAGLSVAPHYGASKCYGPTRNLLITIESPWWWFLDGITLLSTVLNQAASLLISFSPTSEWVSSTPLWQDLDIGEDCWIIALKPFK
jgi:hypothetical protein